MEGRSREGDPNYLRRILIRGILRIFLITSAKLQITLKRSKYPSWCVWQLKLYRFVTSRNIRKLNELRRTEFTLFGSTIFDCNLIRSILLSSNNIRAGAIIFDACDSCLYTLPFAREQIITCVMSYSVTLVTVTFCDIYDDCMRNLLAAINGSGSC